MGGTSEKKGAAFSDNPKERASERATTRSPPSKLRVHTHTQPSVSQEEKKEGRGKRREGRDEEGRAGAQREKRGGGRGG